jgi:hypothetical protein
MLRTNRGMVYTFQTAEKKALEQNPQHIFIYMDDCWCGMIHQQPRRPGLRRSANIIDPAESFRNCLESVRPQVNSTFESEIENKIVFLNVLVTRHDDGRLTSQIYRKPSNTNVLMKPQCCHEPRVHVASFKGEICRATHFCTSPTQAKKEVDFALNIYEDNGHNRSQLEKIAATYIPATSKNRAKERHQYTRTGLGDLHQTDDQSTISLFKELPFNCETEIELRPYAVLPYIPTISNQLKRALGKAGARASLKLGSKLGDILCAKNKTRPDAMAGKGIYKFQCQCDPNATYVEETVRSFEKHKNEHKKAAESGHWQHSGLTQYREDCTTLFNWEPEILSQASGKK